MALGLMWIMGIFLAAVALVGMMLVFAVKGDKAGRVVGLLFALYAMLVCYMAFTSSPSNYLIPRVLACLWCILALVGGVMRQMRAKNYQSLGKLLIAAALVFSAAGVFGYGIF